MYFLSVSTGQESGHSLAGPSAQGVTKLRPRCPLDCTPFRIFLDLSQALLVVGRIQSLVATGMKSSCFLAGTLLLEVPAGPCHVATPTPDRQDSV